MKSFAGKSAIVFLFSVVIIVFHSCAKEDTNPAITGKVPTVVTAAVTYITGITAFCGGSISDTGSSKVIESGICWSIGTNPTVADNRTEQDGYSAHFMHLMTDLGCAYTYYVRAYATNSSGTGYGMVVSFETLLVDGDGNILGYVKIGNQVWLSSNLKTARYSSGDSIGTTRSPQVNLTGDYSNPKYQWPAFNNEYNVVTNGRLYTWYAVTDYRSVCPTGWHIPTSDEWNTLAVYLGGKDVAGGKMKESGTMHWDNPNTDATNESGFNAYGTGWRYADGRFYDYTGRTGVWWSSTEVSPLNAYAFNVNYISASLNHTNNDKRSGLSVRCIRNEYNGNNNY
jgi:uncharacterized protein (TIGR02145 family)